MNAPLYYCAIVPVPHAEKDGETVYEWVVTDAAAEVIAGGYGATRADAANDLRIWREANAGTLSELYWRALTPDNRDFNFTTRAKAEAFAAKCGGSFLGRATVAEMNDILTRSGVLKKGETCK